MGLGSGGRDMGIISEDDENMQRDMDCFWLHCMALRYTREPRVARVDLIYIRNGWLSSQDLYFRNKGLLFHAWYGCPQARLRGRSPIEIPVGAWS